MPFGSPYSPYHQLSRLGSSGVLGSMHPGLPYPGVSHPALVTSSQPDTSPPCTSSSLFVRSRDRYDSVAGPLLFTSLVLLLMAALCNRAGHYIFALWFLSIYLLFFPRLISAATDSMSIILLHMAWP